jgi:hypothetical protein
MNEREEVGNAPFLEDLASGQVPPAEGDPAVIAAKALAAACENRKLLSRWGSLRVGQRFHLRHRERTVERSEGRSYAHVVPRVRNRLQSGVQRISINTNAPFQGAFTRPPSTETRRTACRETTL